MEATNNNPTTTKTARSKSVFKNSKDFVIAYLEAIKKDMTLNEFANSVGMRPLSLRSRAGLLVKKGVNLPKLRAASNAGKRGRSSIDVAELNLLIHGVK